jgi:hypothetical protein
MHSSVRIEPGGHCVNLIPAPLQEPPTDPALFAMRNSELAGRSNGSSQNRGNYKNYEGVSDGPMDCRRAKCVLFFTRSGNTAIAPTADCNQSP